MVKDVIERLTKLSKVGFGYDIKPEDRKALEAAVAALSTSPAGVKPLSDAADAITDAVRTAKERDIEDLYKLAAMVGATFKPLEPAGVGVETPPPSTHLMGDPVGLKPIPIQAAKRIAKEYGYDQVLIYGRRCHDTPEPHGEHMTTYGRTREHCDVAARIGDTLKKFMGWEV